MFWTRWRVWMVESGRQERVAVVDVRQNKRDNKFGDSFSDEVFSDQTDATKNKLASPGSGRDKVCHG